MVKQLVVLFLPGFGAPEHKCILERNYIMPSILVRTVSNIPSLEHYGDSKDQWHRQSAWQAFFLGPPISVP